MRKLVALKSLYAFVAVAETGSMTDAAEVLHVSHSAISQAIKSLENQLGLPLFQRVGRRVELNRNGRKYYRQVAPALEQIVSAGEALQQQNPHRLTLNMVNSLALHWWIPRVPDFQALAPQIDIRISTLTHVFDLDKEGVDVALIHGRSDDWQGYHCEKLGDDQLILVCAPSLIDTGSALSADAMLSAHHPIFVTNPRRENDWQIWCQANQLPVPAQRHNLCFTASIQAVQATLRGLGILVTHRLFVRDEIRQGLLTEIGPSVRNPYQSYYFVCQKEKLVQESVLTLRAWLHHEFRLASA
ncbi:LysR substrate-binding domain-containing protein [Photobacterium sp. 2_MG-2023]|uniref:LysR family transcriptional regulator n=1 Tax=Photobacterium arenosum TaxID=2774143 RepID=A0ABR9BS90_9GAMM|nr:MULTISPECIES: LysR substrate-binding domain-containing protein [Photobacterium]MBD8515134.1 LysR family transcriptional regulator [Photobacterium arenosum]MDO6582812.1 LysR substrate-binding domain-containing protein [Photobacterium sp. 2_MG-2023]